MAATSAGHLQQQHNQQQQKMNTNAATMNNGVTRNQQQQPQQQQQQPQIHNLQQQQQLMQQYALKQQQQQHNYNMQQHMHQQQHQMMQQQQLHQLQHQQQMQLKMQHQQQRQQQQMFENHSVQNDATHMMPCQNYMTPLPQTQNKFVSNGYNNTAAQQQQQQQQQQHFQNHFQNNQRSMPPTQQPTNTPAALLNGNNNNNSINNNFNNNNNNNNNISSKAICIPPNVVAPSANLNIYPNQTNNFSNIMQQHQLNNNNNNNNNNMTTHQHQCNQQLLPNTQKFQSNSNEMKNSNVETRHQMQQNCNANAKQHVANSNHNNSNTICNTNDCITNLPNNLNSNGLNSNGLNTNHLMTQHDNAKANIPPGWRRLTNNNNEIVYISPTGSTLRSPFQIRDYLLSPGTCKCGLPCPLQPEYFFDFNVQVPNTPLTMSTHQNNGFNYSSPNSALSSSALLCSSSSPSLSLPASCSLQQTALTTSTSSMSSSSSSLSEPSGAYVVPPMETSSSSSSSSCSSTIPSATSPSSLTCLHQKRFLDCQQLHAHPMESFNKGNYFSTISCAEKNAIANLFTTTFSNITNDAKRRKIANIESMIDNNNDNTSLLTSLPTLSPAANITKISSESKSIFATDGSGSGQQQQQQTSHNSYKMLPPSMQQQHQEQKLHIQQQQQLANHTQHTQQQHQQTPISNSTYNNGLMESANKTWPTDDNMSAHESMPSAHSMTNGHNVTTHWSNLCNNSQGGLCQTKLQPPAESNNKENQQNQHQQMDLHTSSMFKDDLNGYLQQQTTLVHNSMMNIEQQNDVNENMDDGDGEEADGEDEEDEGEGEGDEEEMTQQQEDEEEEDEEEELDEQYEEASIMKTSNEMEESLTAIEKEEDEEEEEEEDHNEEFGNGEANDVDDDEEPDEAEEDENEGDEDVTEPTLNDQTSLDAMSRPLTSQNNMSFYQLPNSQNQPKPHSFTNIQNILSPSHNTFTSKFTYKPQQQQQQQPQQNLFVQQTLRTPVKLVPTAQESPVSSSTVGGPRFTPDLQRKTPDATKKPEQVGAISTSNESPKPCPPSPASSIELTSSKATKSNTTSCPIPSPLTLHLKPQQQTTTSIQKPPPQQLRILRHIKNAGHIQTHQQVSQQQHQRLVATNTSRATVTTIAGSRGAATTTTLTSSSGQRFTAAAPATVTQKIQGSVQKLTANSSTSIPISQLQLQPLLRSNDNSGNSQIIMTSTGQLIVMPSSNNKPHMQQQHHHHHHQQQQQQQVIIASGNATTTTQSHAATNVIIQQQSTQQMDVLNNTGQLTATLQQQPNGGYIVSQTTNTNGSTTQLQPTTVILNSGTNLLTNNGTKVLTNTGNIIHTAGSQPILTTGNTTNVLGQQTVVLNALPNGGYVIQQQPQPTHGTTQQQPQYTTLDNQVVSQLVQQSDGRIIITSPNDPKRRPKKRKNSPSPAPTQISPTIPNQTATILQQHVANLQAATQQTQAAQQPQVVQLTTAPSSNNGTTTTYPQQFQLSNGLQGIVVNKSVNSATTTQPQQLILQNGQIIQPMNLLGQQLILPSGLVMAPDTTLLQIQNVGSCGPTTNILTTTPQGTMMLRATSPQTNKQFIQSATTGQQYIVGSNGQLSPIGQIYSTPMGLVMPTTTQHNPAGTATFVQQNATIQVQQPQQQVTATPQHITLQTLQQHQQNLNHHHVVNNQVGIVLETATSSTTSPNTHLGNSRLAAASPPDTTTHSPRSPERPPSHRSGGSDMVQCVSSSEPDGGNVSPLSTDSRQSPSSTVCEKGIVMSTAYQNTNIYKPSEAKIRRVQTPPQYHVVGGGNGNSNAAGAGAGGGSGSGNTTTTTHLTGLTNLTLKQQQHHSSNNPQQIHMDNGSNKPDTHDSPQNSPTTTVMITPPPPRTPTPLQQQGINQQQQHLQNSPTRLLEYQQQQQHQRMRTPPKNSLTRQRNRSLKTSPRCVVNSLDVVDNTPISPSASTSPPLAVSLQRTFAVGELIWGPARGFPAWPGKVVKIPDNQQESVWVQWFGGGGRSNTEIMALHLLQSLSEGLEAHHKAQKDTRKSRKLNSQLEKAIQEAMTELDRISASSTTTAAHSKQLQQPTSSTLQHQSSPNRANKRAIPRTGGYDLIAGLTNNHHTSSNAISTTTGSINQNSQPRHKPIRIAPAPPGGAANSPTKSNTSAATLTQIGNSTVAAGK